MKAAQMNTYGGGEVVEINKNASDPVIAPGKVLVEVYAAGVNPVDWKIREGYLKERVPLQFPATLGGDFSGVIKGTGEEVYGQAGLVNSGSGSFAEIALADVKKIARKPKQVSHVEASALPLAGVSAWQALVEHIGLGAGPAFASPLSLRASAGKQKILIHGGAGGIGAFAVQIAKYLGAYVAATASADDITYVKELGADEIIDYKAQRFEDLLREYDAVFDTAGGGGDTYERSFQVVKKGGIIVSMTEQPRQDLIEQYGVNAMRQSTDVTQERLAKLAELVDQGVVKVTIDKVFSIDQAAEALTYLQKNHSRGKVVLEIK